MLNTKQIPPHASSHIITFTFAQSASNSTQGKPRRSFLLRGGAGVLHAHFLRFSPTKAGTDPNSASAKLGQATQMGTISILLVDDHPVVRQGLRVLLTS